MEQSSSDTVNLNLEKKEERLAKKYKSKTAQKAIDKARRNKNEKLGNLHSENDW